MKTPSWPRLVLPTLAAALLTTGLTGCLGLNRQPDTTRFYTLTGSAAHPPAQSATKSNAPALYLNSIEVPAYLHQPGIALRLSKSEISFLTDHQWAEPLRDGIHRLLQQDLASVPEWSVYPALHRRPAGTYLEVQVTILKLELTADQQAVLEARWQILRSPGSVSLFNGSTTTHQTFVAQPTDYGPGVQAISRCVETLGREIADQLPRPIIPEPPAQ